MLPTGVRRRGAEMGQISMAARDELVDALLGRYALGNRKDRGRILDEFVALTGFASCKHAMRLLRAGIPANDPARAAHHAYIMMRCARH